MPPCPDLSRPVKVIVMHRAWSGWFGTCASIALHLGSSNGAMQRQHPRQDHAICCVATNLSALTPASGDFWSAWDSTLSFAAADGSRALFRTNLAKMVARHSCITGKWEALLPWCEKLTHYSGIVLVGMVCVRLGPTFSSPLMQLKPEELFWTDFYGHARGLRFLEVTSSLAFREPIGAASQQRVCNAHAQALRPQEWEDVRKACVCSSHPVQLASSVVEDAITAWSGQAADPSRISVLLLPPVPLALMVVRHELKSLPWLPCWKAEGKNILPGFPGPRHQLTSFVRPLVVDASTMLMPSHFRQTANLIRGLCSGNEEESAHEHMHVGSIVWLLQAAEHIEGIDNEAVQRRAGRYGYRYTASMLVQSLLFCHHLRSAMDLRDTLKKAMRLTLPGVSCTVDELLEKTPSAATLSRARLYVDAAFCLYMRQLSRKGDAGDHQRRDLGITGQDAFSDLVCEMLDVKLFRYLLTDASPQGGHEWLMSEYTIVCVDKAVQVGSAISCLVPSPFVRSSESDLRGKCV